MAKVAYGFGGGFGAGKHGKKVDQPGEAGGGGGGVHAFPGGVLEITEDSTRFIPFTDLRLLALAFAAGAAFGGLILARRR